MQVFLGVMASSSSDYRTSSGDVDYSPYSFNRGRTGGSLGQDDVDYLPYSYNRCRWAARDDFMLDIGHEYIEELSAASAVVKCRNCLVDIDDPHLNNRHSRRAGNISSAG